MADLRSVFRYKTHRPAKILLADGRAIGCTVRNMSTKGACFELPEQAQVPAEFSVIIHGAGTRYRCHRIWTNDKAIGVEFV